MTDTKATPATDEEIAECLETATAFGVQIDPDNREMGRCQICYGPWFKWKTGALEHSPECIAAMAPSILARIAADAETIRASRQERDAVKEALIEAREIISAREAAYDTAQEGLTSARKQEAEMRETIRQKDEEIERLRKQNHESAAKADARTGEVTKKLARYVW